MTIEFEFNNRPMFRHVKTERITIDRRVQRPLDSIRIRKMAKQFRPEALGTVVLSERGDGSLVALDGQHRLELARLVGYEQPLAALVYSDLSLEEEGQMFLALNTSKVPTPVSKFLVGFYAGETAPCAIAAAAAKHGWEVAPNQGTGKITAAAALSDIYAGSKVGSKSPDRDDLVDATLAVITAAWGHDPTGVRASILLGVAGVIARYGDKVSIGRLISKMEAVTPTKALAQGNAGRDYIGGTEYAGVSRWLVNEYNKGIRKDRLSDWLWLK